MVSSPSEVLYELYCAIIIGADEVRFDNNVFSVYIVKSDNVCLQEHSNMLLSLVDLAQLHSMQ